MSRTLLDTNVLISAYGFGGRPRALLEAVLNGRHELITSPALMAELARVLALVLGMDDAHVRRTIDQLIRVSTIVEPAEHLSVCRDPSDDRVLECAVTGHAEFIVTGDEDLLCMREFRGVRVMRVSQAEGL